MKKNKGLLLFKNAFKQVFRNKIQLIGLAFLTLLSSTIFSLMQTSITRVNNEYQILISEEQSNIHDFIFDPYNTAKKTNAPKPSFNPPYSSNNKGTLEDQQLYLNEIANKETNKFIWERVETRTFQINNNNNPKVLKLISYNQYARINKLIINHGYNIGQNPNNKTPISKQTVINKEFAEKNNLKIGDIIRIQEDRLGSSLKVNYDINDPKFSSFNWLQIVGYGVSADFITPIINETTPLPNKTKEGILYINPIQFGLKPAEKKINNNTLWYYNKAKELLTIASNKDAEIYYIGKWTTNEKNLNEIINFFKERYTNISNLSSSMIYALGDTNYRFNNRTSILASTINSFTTLLICLLLIVLLITGVTVILITYKNIDNSKPQIGILKSLGYSNWKILITSVAYPMLAAFLGTILVFFPASGLQILVVNTFANYFNLNFGRFFIDGLGFLYCFLLIFGFLSLIAWIISALTVIKNPITLINNISTTRDSKFTKFVKKNSVNRSFLTRFRLALFTSSIGKMAAAALTMFLGTVLMTTAIIGPKIMSDNQKVSYTGMNYKALTEYVMPTYNSPYSFYKTYNPNNKAWDYTTAYYDEEKKNYYTHPNRTSEQYAQELLENNINSEAYAPIAPNPSEDPSSLTTLSMSGLTYLHGKIMTKSFLTGLEKSDGDLSFIISLVLKLAWPEAIPSQEIATDNKPNNLYNLKNYQILKTFYNNYRSTINMNLNPKITSDSNPNTLDKEKFKTFVSSAGAWKADETNFKTELDNFKFDTRDSNYPWHIEKEEEFLNSFNPTDEFRNEWIRKSLIWYYSIFYNRFGQIVIQGTYTKSPYFIKQNIAKAFENSDAKFNISFNVLPFNQDTDELGTYFIGTPLKKFANKSYPIKVYGLQSDKELGRPSFMQLWDSRGGITLNSDLERSDSDAINMIINQTTAKQLNLKTNETFYMTTNGKIMKAKEDEDTNHQEINVEEINFDKINNDNPATENNATLLNQNVYYNQIPKTVKGAYSNLGINPTSMLNEAVKSNVVIDHDNQSWHKFKIVGIYNGYGQPAAYISKSNADKLLRFTDYEDENGIKKPGTTRALYEIYKREWQKKGIVKVKEKDINFNKLENLSYQQFQELKENDPLKIIFKNEFPIFNFKFSNNDKLPDISETFSVSQNYGDFSAFGMNGGFFANKFYQGYGQGTVTNLLPLYVHKQLLEQITQLVNIVLLFFIIFSLIISFFIILLTSNLVIYENKKIIVTMKTLGYSDAKITNIVIGMYLPVIAAMFIIGFPIGLFIVKLIINYLAYNTTWVLPFLFSWWIPIIVGLIVLGIYATTFIIEWQALKKIKILQVINETN